MDLSPYRSHHAVASPASNLASLGDFVNVAAMYATASGFGPQRPMSYMWSLLCILQIFRPKAFEAGAAALSRPDPGSRAESSFPAGSWHTGSST